MNLHFCQPRAQVGMGEPSWLAMDQEAYDRDRHLAIALLNEALEDVDFVPDGAAGAPQREKKQRSAEPNIGVQNIYILSDQARFNYQSADQSTNTIQVSTPELFQEMRAAIESGIASAAERREILDKLDELKAAQGSNQFLAKYQAFIALAANHMTLLAPFIPALTSLLKP